MNFKIPHGKKKKLFVYQLGKHPFSTNINNVSVIKDFYTISINETKKDYSIETEINARIEGISAPIHKRLLSKDLNFTTVDKLNYAYFLWSIFVRTTNFLESIELNTQKMIKHLMMFMASNKELHYRNIKQWLSSTGEEMTDDVIEDMRQFALDDSRYKIEIAKEHKLKQMLDTGNNHLFMNMIANMKWSLLTTTDNTPFITSDNPVVMFNPKTAGTESFYSSPGLGQKHVEITFPLSHNLCLFLSWEKDFGIFDVSSQINKINYRTANYANEVYIGICNDYIEKLMEPFVNNKVKT